ncbi:MAG TPA: peptidase domain-containing ABC transporter [Gaiellaceae bacterium]|nr:peptidase domain-containing ABC transporter [Gaiellaceae bacterium]
MSAPEALLVAELPAFAILPEGVRTLVAESFEPVSFPFGAVIVREGEVADAFYVLAEGSARVVKQGEHGDEVPLNVLRRGDSFGEMALLSDTVRLATVRASSPVEALRLDKSVFTALARSHPPVAEAFETLSRGRSLWNFFRVNSAFSELSNEALGLLVSQLERVDVPAGEVIVREGDPPGPMYVIEQGRVRAFKTAAGVEIQVGFLRTGDFFGERSLFRNEPRAASVQAVSDCSLLVFPSELFRRLVEEHPDFRLRLEQRIEQYDYRRVANVPLDFAEELLPADATVQQVAPEEVELEPELDDLDEPDAQERQKPIRRFPHVFQLDEMDCGAACLAMICRHFGRSVAVSHIRQAVHTAIDGTTLAGITRGAEELGLSARSVRASKSRLDDLPLPAVAHWEGNHWVVVYRVDDKHVRVADPARGLRRIPRQEFLERWSGYTSVVGYTERLNEVPEARTSLAWVKPFLRPHLRLVLLAVGLAIIAAALELVLPILTQVVVDRVLPNGDLGLLWILIAAIAGVLVAITGATVIQSYLLSKVAVRFDVSTLDFLTGRLLDLPMSYFATRRTGDIERRLLGARQVRAFFIQSGVQALTSVTQLLAALGLMLFYSWKLALVYLATVPAYGGLMRFSAKRLRPMYDNLEEAYGRYSSGQIDAIRGIETVKALAAEAALRRLMLGRFQALADRVFRTEFLVLAYQGSLQLVAFASFGLFLLVGSIEVVHGNLSLGEFVAFNALVALATGPMLTLLSLWDEGQFARVLFDRLDDVVGPEPEQGADRDRLRPVSTLEGRVELHDVGFRYGGPEAPPILEGVTLTVEPGETVALVGRSGSGKTTLIKLLAGLLEPTEGEIRFDGFELRTLDYRTLRRQIGFVLQESYLFDDTIAGNIAFGESEPDPAKVAWAAKAASAHEFVERLPLGFQTRVGESGLRLSGGQQQRIAIARALYHRPPILLFDEATSALDTESERAVKESLDELLVGRTSFVIAHRLSTVKDANRIVVLERGRLVESGTHDELMARQGLYFYLASQQLEL